MKDAKQQSKSKMTFGKKEVKDEETDPLMRRLNRIRDSYSPDSTSYRFQVIAYNTKGGKVGGLGGGATKPASLTEEDWQQALAIGTPNNRTPVLIQGFDGLETRSQTQLAVVEKMKGALVGLKARIEEMRGSLEGTIRDKMAMINDKNNEIDARMMEIMQVNEVNSLKDVAFNPNEEELLEKLEALERQINKPNGYAATLNMLKNKTRSTKEGVSARSEVILNSDAKEGITSILKTNTRALKALTDSVKESKAAQDSLEAQLKRLLDE